MLRHKGQRRGDFKQYFSDNSTSFWVNIHKKKTSYSWWNSISTASKRNMQGICFYELYFVFWIFLPTKSGFCNSREQPQAPPHLHSTAKHIGDVSNCLWHVNHPNWCQAWALGASTINSRISSPAEEMVHTREQPKTPVTFCNLKAKK